MVRHFAARAALAAFAMLALFSVPQGAEAGCLTVNGSALNNLDANETVNCGETGSSALASNNDGITVNLLQGLEHGAGANFATLADSNLIEGADFFILAGGTVIDAGNGNILHLSNGYLSGAMFGIVLQSGNNVWLTDMEVHGDAAALDFGGVTYSVLRNSLIESSNIGLTTGINSIVTATDSTFVTGANAIEANDGSVVTVTGGSIDSATNGIFVGTGSSVFLTDTSIEAGAVGVRLGAGSQAILLDVEIESAAQGILGTVGFVLVTDSKIVSTGSAAISKNGATTLIDSTLMGVVGFVANDSNLAADLTVTGSTITGNTNSVILSDVADILTLNTGGALNSPNGADGGAGIDQILLQGTGAEDEVFTNFETLTMDGADWSLTGDSSVTDIDVQNGRLRINANIAATNSAVVDPTGIIGGNGNLTTPLLDVSGGVAPGNSVGTLTVTGNYLQNGGFMEVEFDKNGLDLLQVTGTATLAGDPTLIVKPLGGAGGAAGTFLVAGGGLTGTFGAVEFAGNGGATVVYQANSASLFVAQPTGVVAEESIVLGQGERILSILGNEQLTHLGAADRQFWATGLGLFGSRDAENGNAAYEYDTAGALVGSDLYAANGWRFGLGAGYGNTSIDIDGSAGESELNGAVGLAYGSYEWDRWFVSGRIAGGWHDIDASRTIATDTELDHALSDSDAWLLGTGVSLGANLPFEGGWKLSPRINLDYVRQWHGDVHEGGGSGGAIDIDGYSTSALTASGQFRVGRTLDFDAWTVEPFVQAGVAQRIALGDRKTGAAFQETDDTFDVELEHEDHTLGLVDVGAILDFKNGVSAQLSYGGRFANDGEQHGIMATVRASW